jgi:hypothetical protein
MKTISAKIKFKKLFGLIISLAFLAGLLTVFSAPAVVRADCVTPVVNTDVCPDGSIPSGSGSGSCTSAASCACTEANAVNTSGTNSCDANTSGQEIGGLANTIINIMSIIVGVIAVIMIIVGGIKYATSGGDQNNLESAKNTIVYALVGLVIAVLAQVLIHFVINRVSTSTSKNPSSSSTTGQ